MNAYRCTVEQAMCDRARNCMLRREPDRRDLVVIEFKPIAKYGKYCPHYMAEFESPLCD